VTPDKVEQIIAELRHRYGDGTKSQ
jgi:hypothetical protein